MSLDNFSIAAVMTTVSRPSLAKALCHLRHQRFSRNDRVYLLSDGPSLIARSFWPQFGFRGKLIEFPEKQGFWGHPMRNDLFETGEIEASWIIALDDDDALVKDAFAIIRDKLKKAKDVHPHFFRMKDRVNNRHVWDDEKIRPGNVGNPIFVFPNVPEKIGRYGLTYTGDYDFIEATMAAWDGECEWHEDVIIDVWPTKNESGFYGR